MAAQHLLSRLIISVLFTTAFFIAVIFIPGETFDWWRGWVLIAVTALAFVVSLGCLYRGHQDLLEERLKPPIQKGQPLADKIILIIYLIVFVGQTVFIPLDVFRFHLTAPPNVIVSWLGMALYITGWGIITLALLQNAFASPAVKYQEEHHQHVIDTGLYSFVRHPMYSSLIPLSVGMALWLGSYIGALLTIVPLSVIAGRILIEERLLKQELKGYDDYTKKVRYRLIPLVW